MANSILAQHTSKSQRFGAEGESWALAQLTTRGLDPRPPTKKVTIVLTWFVGLAVFALAVGSFVLSFNALLSLAITAGGIPPAIAFIWPLIVDLSLVVYTATVLTSQLQKWPLLFPASLIVFYAGVTTAGNIMHAPPTWAGWFIASLPPLSLVLATEVLRTVVKQSVTHAAALSSIAELTATQERLAADIAAQQQQAAALDARIVTGRQELGVMKREKFGITEDTKARARAILAERADISGAELARRLGKSDSLGRLLRRELLPTLAAVDSETGNHNGHNVNGRG